MIKKNNFLKWKNVLENVENILHLRIIVCWCGFTSKQIDSINEHNKNFPLQPIILICAKKENIKELYGEKVVEHFAEKGYNAPNPKKKFKIQDLYEKSAFEMKLSPKEKSFEMLLQQL